MRIAEGVVIVGALAGVSAGVFLAGAWRYPYPLFPLLVLATLRFRQAGAAAGSFIVAAFAIAGAIGGQTPLPESPTTAVAILQGFIAFVAVSMLVLGATLQERDRALEDLLTTLGRLAEAQRLASIGSWEWDVPSGRVTWSDELFRIYDVPPETPLDVETFLEYVHEADRDRVLTVIEEAARERHAFEVTHRIVVGGREKIVVGRGDVVADEAGRLLRMAGTAQDVTEQRAAESLRDNILSTVSHELRTPLTSILGFALTLRDRGAEVGESLRRDMTEHVVSQATRLERLLTDLLDVERLRHGFVRATREATDIPILVGRVAEATGYPVTVEGHAVVADVDPPKLERIVENLLTNAIKHTPPGTEITARVLAEGSDLLLVVDDRGDGVADADKLQVFDLFHRPSANGAPGTGVGLALVAQFARLHGGTVWVEDRDGGGASFRVRLPDCVVEPLP
jgi:signal transduction histidine kinase